MLFRTDRMRFWSHLSIKRCCPYSNRLTRSSLYPNRIAIFSILMQVRTFARISKANFASYKELRYWSNNLQRKCLESSLTGENIQLLYWKIPIRQASSRTKSSNLTHPLTKARKLFRYAWCKERNITDNSIRAHKANFLK